MAYSFCGISGSGKYDRIPYQYLVCGRSPGCVGGPGVRGALKTAAGSICDRILHTVHHGPPVYRQVSSPKKDRHQCGQFCGTGTAILAGETWLARAAVEGETFEPNTVVVITSVSGAKLMVKAAQPEHRVEQPKEE